MSESSIGFWAALATIVAVPIAIYGIVLAHNDATGPPERQRSSATATAPSLPTITGAPAPSAAGIRITAPPNTPSPYLVPRVISVQGTGDVPSGRHLWIFVYSSGIYYPQDNSLDSSTPSPWAIPGVIIGSTDQREEGQEFRLYALLVDDSTHARIQSSSNGFDENTWAALFRQYVVDEVKVRRKS